MPVVPAHKRASLQVGHQMPVAEVTQGLHVRIKVGSPGSRCDETATSANPTANSDAWVGGDAVHSGAIFSQVGIRRIAADVRCIRKWTDRVVVLQRDCDCGG